ncbi:chitin synthase export chaperone [Aureobasidium subglaciale]|nr:chitin synthase export chaperone [Aureobasidium subglaciale]KAI5224064.1 chitin synthase export chaperone [Aureobasidium subglaciale]KAI5228368.1 chitin synthase export chaperone [Aureobasidium subglaciale]
MGFGDFDSICKQAALPLCTMVGRNIVTGDKGIQPACYSRTIEVANTVIFQGAAGIAHICALLMTVIMIVHVRSKFTAVGRKEIISFFWGYFLLTIISLLVDAGVVPPGSAAYPWFVALQNGLASATCISLMIAGFVGFQLYEDGTFLSVWLLRICSATMFAISFIISIMTFKDIGGLGPDNTVGLFVVLYIFNAIFLAVYVVMQVLLVVGTLQDRWPLGHIAFGIFFFVVGQVIIYAFGKAVCEGINHYMDGLVIATVCNLLAVMMIYKFWDSITKEDLEFSVGARVNNWDLKAQLLNEEEKRATMYMDSEYDSSLYYQAPRQQSMYGSSTGN